MKITSVLLGLSLAAAAASVVTAQDTPTPSMPAVLTIQREYVKPYKSGMAHDKTETAIAAAFARAKFPGYYIGLNSMSGRSRGLYLTSYPSYAEWEKDNKILAKNAALNADVDRTEVADGDLLEGLDSAVFTYDSELSYHTHADVSHARYFELTVFHVRPGHSKEWHEVSKMYRDLMDQANPGAHWATYDAAYGVDGGTSISITSMSSLAEIDQNNAAFAKVMDAAGGPDGWDKIDKLFGEAVDTYRSELFSVNPKQSYVSDDWIKSDADFWRPKPAKAGSETAAAKPAAKAGKPGAR